MDSNREFKRQTKITKQHKKRSTKYRVKGNHPTEQVKYNNLFIVVQIHSLGQTHEQYEYP